MAKSGWLLTAACLFYFSWRLFVPPVIGVANNGDFPKITGWMAVGPVSGSYDDDEYRYVTTRYTRSPKFAWQSHYYSSEQFFAWAGDGLARLWQRSGEFDVRWMGLVHLSVLMAGFAWLMAALQPMGIAVQCTAGAAIALIFGDAAYLGYANSFYTDAGALASAMVMLSGLIDLAVRGYSRTRLIGTTAGAMLLASSKPLHAALAILPAVLVYLLVRNRAAVIAGAAILAAAVLLVVISPGGWKTFPLFDVTFQKVAAHSPAPAKDLADLGLGPENVRYVGMNAFQAGNPTSDQKWSDMFLRQVTMGRLARFYLTHPRRTAGILWRDLKDQANQLEVRGLGYYARGSGRGPAAPAPGYWSGLRGDVLRRAPWTAPLWLLLVSAGCLARRSKLSWICLMAAAMAAGEFVLASLLDAVDTSRHLFFFHVMTEVTICFAVTALASAVAARSAELARWRPARRLTLVSREA